MENGRWWLYTIECGRRRIYTGISNDPSARYADHVAGRGALFTRKNPPRRLLAQVPFASRGLAAKAERSFKKLPAYEKWLWSLAIGGVDLEPGLEEHVRNVFGADVDRPDVLERRFMNRLRELGHSASA